MAFQTAEELGILPSLDLALTTWSRVNLLVVFPEFMHKVVPPIIIFGPSNAPTVNMFVEGLYLKLSLLTGVPTVVLSENQTWRAASTVAAPIPE